jgi:hypothetical protein
MKQGDAQQDAKSLYPLRILKARWLYLHPRATVDGHDVTPRRTDAMGAVTAQLVYILLIIVESPFRLIARLEMLSIVSRRTLLRSSTPITAFRTFQTTAIKMGNDE